MSDTEKDENNMYIFLEIRNNKLGCVYKKY